MGIFFLLIFEKFHYITTWVDDTFVAIIVRFVLNVVHYYLNPKL